MAQPPAAYRDLGKVGVSDDMARVREFVDQGLALVGYAVFIDESNSFRYRTPHPDSCWVDWPGVGPRGDKVSVLWARFAQPRLLGFLRPELGHDLALAGSERL